MYSLSSDSTLSRRINKVVYCLHLHIYVFKRQVGNSIYTRPQILHRTNNGTTRCNVFRCDTIIRFCYGSILSFIFLCVSAVDICIRYSGIYYQIYVFKVYFIWVMISLISQLTISNFKKIKISETLLITLKCSFIFILFYFCSVLFGYLELR